MKWLLILMLASSLSNCSNLEDSILATSVEPNSSVESDCFQKENRTVEVFFENIKGRVIGPDNNGLDSCPTVFVLSKPKESELYLNLAPCNLSDSLKKNGLKVIYSGLLFETFETEDICARHFEITDITLLEEK